MRALPAGMSSLKQDRAQMFCSLRRSKRADPCPNAAGKFLAAHAQVIFRRYRFTEVDFDLAKSSKEVKSPGLGGHALHILYEHRHYRHARFPGDVINSGLAGRHVHAIAAGALRKYDQLKLPARAAELLQLPNPARVEPATVQEIANAAADRALYPRCVPHRFVTEDENGIAARPPEQGAKQDGVQQAHVVGHKQL